MRPSDRLNWDDLKLVLALAETGYINQAAERLRLDPTTLPRRLRRIEKTLGVKLIERVKGGVVLAPITDELVGIARQVEDTVNRALATGGEEHAAVTGVVKISATDFTFELIAPELTSLLRQHPGIQLDMRPGNTYLSIEKRETDVAVRLGTVPAEGLVGRKVSDVKTAVYAHPALAELGNGLPWVSWNFPRGLTANDGFIESVDPQGKVVARIDSMVSQAKLVSEGMGAARLPCAFIESRSELKHLTKLYDGPPETAWIVTHEELRNVPRVKLVSSAIADAFRRFGD